MVSDTFKFASITFKRSQTQTNHSLRAAGATALYNANVPEQSYSSKNRANSSLEALGSVRMPCPTAACKDCNEAQEVGLC